MPWIETVEPEESKGSLKQQYEAAIRRAGKVYNIVKISSLRPDIIRAWVQFYSVLMHGPGELDRRAREMIAVAVSRENTCFY